MRDYGEDGLAIYEDGTKETQEEHNRLLEEEAARQGKDGKGEGEAGTERRLRFPSFLVQPYACVAG